MSVDTNPNHKGGCVFKDEAMDAICIGETCNWTRRQALREQGFEMVPDGPVLIPNNLRRLMAPHEFQVVTICGSMRFYDRMLKVAERWTAAGSVVLMPFVAIAPDHQSDSDTKAMLDRMHRQKIDMADLVLMVTDPETQYVGESTLAELEYTRTIGKPYQWVFEGA